MMPPPRDGDQTAISARRHHDGDRRRLERDRRLWGCARWGRWGRLPRSGQGDDEGARDAPQTGEGDDEDSTRDVADSKGSPIGDGAGGTGTRGGGECDAGAGPEATTETTGTTTTEPATGR